MDLTAEVSCTVREIMAEIELQSNDLRKLEKTYRARPVKLIQLFRGQSDFLAAVLESHYLSFAPIGCHWAS